MRSEEEGSVGVLEADLLVKVVAHAPFFTLTDKQLHSKCSLQIFGRLLSISKWLISLLAIFFALKKLT